MSGSAVKSCRALAALFAGVLLAVPSCASVATAPKTTMQGPIDPEVISAIDGALQSLNKRMAEVHTEDFPEQVVFLYGPPSRIRHKIEKGSRFDSRRPATEEVVFTMYIYDLYDLAVRADPKLAAHPREAIYDRAPLAGLSPQLYFVFVEGRLHTISSHEFF